MNATPFHFLQPLKVGFILIRLISENCFWPFVNFFQETIQSKSFFSPKFPSLHSATLNWNTLSIIKVFNPINPATSQNIIQPVFLFVQENFCTAKKINFPGACCCCCLFFFTACIFLDPAHACGLHLGCPTFLRCELVMKSSQCRGLVWQLNNSQPVITEPSPDVDFPFFSPL